MHLLPTHIQLSRFESEGHFLFAPMPSRLRLAEATSVCRAYGESRRLSCCETLSLGARWLEMPGLQIDGMAGSENSTGLRPHQREQRRLVDWKLPDDLLQLRRSDAILQIEEQGKRASLANGSLSRWVELLASKALLVMQRFCKSQSLVRNRVEAPHSLSPASSPGETAAPDSLTTDNPGKELAPPNNSQASQVEA